MTNTLLEDATEKLESDNRSHERYREKNRIAAYVLEELVLPHMPHSLEEMFELGYVSSVIDALRLDLSPKQEDGSTRELFGTITKVANGLRRGGWTITKDATPSPMYATGTEFLRVELQALQKVAIPGPRRWPFSTTPEPQDVLISLNFERMPESDMCRLVEQEVVVEAVEAHTVTRTVLVCDGEEAEDND